MSRIHRGLAVAGCLLAASVSAHGQVPQPLGDLLTLSEASTETVFFPTIAAGGEGYLATWGVGAPEELFPRDAILARRVDRQGRPLGPPVTLSPAGTFNLFPQVAARKSGGYVVIWLQGDESQGALAGRLLDSEGKPVGPSFPVTDSSADLIPWLPDVVEGRGESILVAWGGLVPAGVLVRRFDSSGMPLDEPVRVDHHPLGRTFGPDMTVAEDGTLVVAWSSEALARGEPNRVFARRLSAEGTPLEPPFLLGTHGASVQFGAVVETLPTGGFVAIWLEEESAGFASVWARQFDTDGKPVFGEIRLDEGTVWEQNQLALVRTDDGFFVAWRSLVDGQIAATGRALDHRGTPLEGEIELRGPAEGILSYPEAAASNSSLVVVWHQPTTDTSLSFDVRGRLLAYPLFRDGFESGDATEWSAAQLGD